MLERLTSPVPHCSVCTGGHWPYVIPVEGGPVGDGIGLSVGNVGDGILVVGIEGDVWGSNKVRTSYRRYLGSINLCYSHNVSTLSLQKRSEGQLRGRWSYFECLTIVTISGPLAGAELGAGEDDGVSVIVRILPPGPTTGTLVKVTTPAPGRVT